MGKNKRRGVSSRRLDLLRVLATEPERYWYTDEIAKAMGVIHGTLYPTLAWAERMGQVVSRWDDSEPHRRVYRLNTKDEVAP